jgi:23S rRNA (cytosine1962-C5)-methyltransferase
VQLRAKLRGPRTYAKHVLDAGRDAPNGGMVAVLSGEREHLGWALWHPDSMIALRVLSRDEAPPTAADLRARAAQAAQRRLDDPEIPEEICRILHGEGDGFPGLLVDRYGPVLVGQCFSRGSGELFKVILPALHEVLGTIHHRLEFDSRSARAELAEPFEVRSVSCPKYLKIEENGVRYELDFLKGHKTGFFCDQRENRARFAKLAEGKRVLDVCCYTGGFAISAAMGGAVDVLGIDLDENAIAQGKRNANLNGSAIGKTVRFVHTDAFSYLRTLGRNKHEFDLIVVDPPKFVPNRHAWDEGMAKYHDINKLAIMLLAQGGQMVSCSCSGIVQSIDLQEIIRRSARLRPLSVVRTTGAGPDHPVALDFPEGQYLKALWMQAD